MNHCPSGSSPEGFFSREFAAPGEHSRRRRRIPGENMFSKTEKERRERMEDYLRRSMERYGESVYRLALCRLRSVPDAEDVCQDVFLRLLRKGDPAWDEERTKAFLLRCAVNRCADLGRQRQRRRESPWEELPDRPAEERDEARALWEAVGQLPPPQRTVIHLHYGEGYATGEIAAILRIPAATVRTRLYRGREKLRELLGGDYEL